MEILEFLTPSKKFEEKIVIRAKEYDRINQLLAINSLEDMADDELLKAGANTHSNEGIFFVQFNDGSSLNFDLCSGTTNYWDDVVWTSADGNRDIILNCEYKLGDIEFEVDDALYTVRVVRGGGFMRAVNIEWDVDFGDDVSLPNEIDIPEYIIDEDEISDYLSDLTGYCHKGFELRG